jgi:hypothetical protein
MPGLRRPICSIFGAGLTSPALAPRYLRRLRESSAAEARKTGRGEVLAEVSHRRIPQNGATNRATC